MEMQQLKVNSNYIIENGIKMYQNYQKRLKNSLILC